VVHARSLGDRTYTFIVSGKLWRNSLIMQDVETGSLWSHITGEALDGPAKGQHLNSFPSVQTTWAEWIQQHPETSVLKKEREITGSSYERYFKDPAKVGIFRARWLVEKMPGKTLVHGITRGPHALAIGDANLKGLVTATLGEVKVVLWRSADGGARAYVAELDGKPLELIPQSSEALKDRATGSTWNLDRGVCVSGPLAGRTLQNVPVTTAYWFAWSSFYANTAVVE
jgi:hypothetical protein